MAGTTAMLCRSNDEVLLISRRLHDLGVPHRLQRSAQDKAIPSWVGSLFRELDSKQPQKTEVLDVLGRAASIRRSPGSFFGASIEADATRRSIFRRYASG